MSQKRPVYTWIKTGLCQMAGLLALALATGFGVNLFHPRGIPITTPPPADTAPDTRVISLADARKAFEAGTALFVDARNPDQFSQGHIQGAVNVPFQLVDHYFIDVLGQTPTTRMIITYCDGETCLLSHELATFLTDMGFTRVRVLVNGWGKWQANHLPSAGETMTS